MITQPPLRARKRREHEARDWAVTLWPSFLTRFAAKHDGHRHLGDEAFGSQEWQGVFQQPPSGKFTFLREQYRNTLRQAGLDAMWKVDPYRLGRVSGLGEFHAPTLLQAEENPCPDEA
ncbi:hypothetical protein AB0O75_45505 [Streptomyces sp. NPDC088921]|uniref:hypothetical protein n=1 Tax=unclassified Streptomyces TaxID=2593676 RepID=UPI00341F58E3